MVSSQALAQLALRVQRARHVEAVIQIAVDGLAELGLQMVLVRAEGTEAPPEKNGARAVEAPLVVQDRLWGTAWIAGKDLSADDERALASFAAQLAMALQVAQTIQELEDRNRELASILAVARAGSTKDLEQLLREVLAITLAATASDRAGFYLLNAKGTELVLTATSGYRTPLDAAYQRMPVTSEWYAPVLSQLKPRARTTRSPHSEWPGQPIETLLVPVHIQGKPEGVVTLVRKGPRPYGDSDVRFAEILAAQIAIQVENARLYSDARRRVRDLSLINELGALVAQHLGSSEVLELGVRNLARIADVPEVSLMLRVPGTRLLRTAASNAPSIQREPVEISLDERSIVSLAVREGRPISVADLPADPRSPSRLKDRFGYRSGAAIPLIARGEPIGAVFLGDPRPDNTTAMDLDLLLAASGPLAAAVANARLFEDLKRSYDTLAQTQKELVKQERLAALGELAASVAHEVRNPLAVIFNSLGSLKKLPAQSPGADLLLGIAEEEADRLNRIVGDLLDFARPNEPVLQPASLESVLRAAVEVAARAVNRSPEDLELHIPDGMPLVPADARLLRQALINLMVNALQATATGGHVRLSASSEREGERLVARVDVADDGPGIPTAVTEHIFQPFFTTKATGTGLGLAVVKRIIEAHRGNVAFVSSPQSGTTFTVRLPISPP